MPLEPAPSKGPIFIIGAMGTGSTLLRLVLDSHPAIAIPPETGFMRAYKAHKFIPFKWSGRNWAKRLGWSDEEMDVELAQFYDRLFMRYVETHGKRRWGEKTPLHTWHVDAMARLFPEAVFVVIIRHLGGSIASNMTRWEHGFTRAAGHTQRYTREQLRLAAKYPDRTVLVRYEDLLLQPEPLLRELVDWLGEEWSDVVLEHHKVQEDRGGKEVVEGRVRVTDPLDVSRMSKWTATLGPKKRQQLERQMGRLGAFLGYSMTDPAVLDPINGDGRMLTGGHDIDARIDDFADLDLHTRGTVPRYERYYHPRNFVMEAPDKLEQVQKAARRGKAPQLTITQQLALKLPAPLRLVTERSWQRLKRRRKTSKL